MHATIDILICGAPTPINREDYLDWLIGAAPWPGAWWVGPIWWS